MKTLIDKNKFGPWALVTGASSGIGKEMAVLLASGGFDLVLVARRTQLLQKLSEDLADAYGTRSLAITADLSRDNAIGQIIDATNDLEIGLLISNAGTGKTGRLFDREEAELLDLVKLNAVSHLRLAYCFGKKMAERRKGGILLTGAMGAIHGVPYMANEAGTKGYIEGLGKSLHAELRELGVHVTVLITTPTDTDVFYDLGFTLENTPVKPLSARQCAKEALKALSANKITVVPGLKFKIMKALTPPSLSRAMSGKMIRTNNKIN
jgi:hypothetical protein